MSAQSSAAPEQPPAKTKGLTPLQIGAGVGAALTVLILLVVRDLSPRGAAGNLSNVLVGVLGAVGAVLGIAVASLVNFLRHRKKEEDDQKAQGATKTEAVVQPAAPPEGQAERNGNPILRVVAGLLALLFTAILVLIIAQGKLGWDGGVLMAAVAVLFGWYAVRGNKGLPQFLTKK